MDCVPNVVVAVAEVVPLDIILEGDGVEENIVLS